MRSRARGTVVVHIEGGVTQRHRIDVQQVLNPGDYVVVTGDWEDRK